MELLFLGTCACDFSPKLQNECKDCFDNDARRASAVLLNGHILIDCGMHVPDSMRIAGVEHTAITDVLVTHTHRDHFDAGHLQTIASAKQEPLRVWVSEEAVLPPLDNVELHRMTKLQTYTLDDGLQVTGLYANHDPEFFPQHFLLEQDGKSVLYATDGAWCMLKTYYYLRNRKVDLFVVDATVGDYEGDFRMAEHNSIPMIRLMLPSLKTAGIIDDHTETYLTHLAPSLHKPHAETAEIVKADGMKVAYDGLTLSV